MVDCKLLLVDEDELIRRVMSRGLQGKVAQFECVADLDSAIALMEKSPFDIVVSETHVNGAPDDDLSAFNFIRSVKTNWPETEVIAQIGYGATDAIGRALRAGAFDYVEKPFKLERLLMLVTRALENKKIRTELSTLRQQVAFDYGFDNFVGASPATMKLKERLAKISETDSPVLIIGENGSGKTTAARAIHYHSRRRREKLMTFDCADVSERMMETELFGSRDTGKSLKGEGVFQRANGSTLIIENIELMTTATQTRLVDAIKRTTTMAPSTGHVDVRIIATTTLSQSEFEQSDTILAELVTALTLNAIMTPSLRTRKEDITELTEMMLRKYSTDSLNITTSNSTTATTPKTLSAAALEKLFAYSWPGNIRELQNVIKRAVALAQKDVVQADDVFFTQQSAESVTGATGSTLEATGSLEMTYRARILKSLEDNDWNFSQTAQELGIGRTTLWRKVKKFNLKRELVAAE